MQGNPRYYSTFVDEGLNGLVSKMASAVHKLTWERRLFEKFKRVHGGFMLGKN